MFMPFTRNVQCVLKKLHYVLEKYSMCIWQNVKRVILKMFNLYMKNIQHVVPKSRQRIKKKVRFFLQKWIEKNKENFIKPAKKTHKKEEEKNTHTHTHRKTPQVRF